MALALGRRIGLHVLDRLPMTWNNPRSGGAVPWWAVVAAALTPVLLTAGWLVAGAVQPPSYSPVRDTVSALAGFSGTDRWIMTDAMLLAGATYLVTAAGLTCLRMAARILLLVSGLCSVGVAMAPEPAVGPTALHLAWAVLGAITLTIWPAVAGWRAPSRSAAVSARWFLAVTTVFAAMLCWVALQSLGGGTLSLGGGTLGLGGGTLGPGGGTLGLGERAVASVQTWWPFVVALLLRRRFAQSACGLVGRPAQLGRPLPDRAG